MKVNNAPAKKSSALKGSGQNAAIDSPAPDREQMIAEGAYFRAEQRGFAPGHEMIDWLQAEADVNRALRALH